MTTITLSQHSSNPLDRGSSDNPASKRSISLFKNSRYPQSSDDPLFLGGPETQMRDFIKHIEKVHPAAGASMKKQSVGKGPVKSRKNVIDLDDDGSDELWMAGDDAHKHKKMRKTLEESREEEKEVEAEIEDFCYEDEQEDDEEFAVVESSSDDEENSLSKKPAEEQEEIIEEIEDLEKAVPQLSQDYKLLDRLGTGTFSSVYKALDLHYHENAPRPAGAKVYVAVKRIYVTSSPERIRNEISILDECRSCRHVSPLITAFRQDDQVVVIMPYQRNDDFRVRLFLFATYEGHQGYMRCLFRALRDIHSRRIIHRDVKPANFLFDPRTGVGTLCDFGLACRMDPGAQSDRCLHSPATAEHPHGKPKYRGEYDEDLYKQMGKDARKKSLKPSEEVGYLEKDTRPQSKANRAGTRGFRAPEVLLKCGDQTGAVDVWSAGMILLFFLTRKFPLFQSNDDVEALMEIATIIGKKSIEEAACLHSRTFATNVPSIKHDGISWSEFVERQNPNLRSVPEPDVRFYPYTKAEEHDTDVANALDLVEKLLHARSTKRITPRDALYHPFLHTYSGSSRGRHRRGAADPLVDEDTNMEPDTEDDSETEMEDDDEFFPHPFGEGVCSRWHFRDDVTEEPCVYVYPQDEDEGYFAGDDSSRKQMMVRTLTSGEGIAIGSLPCEFHRVGYELDVQSS
ncbi:kinase-like protein [Gymnopus androsaceus JB14]|uniref:non-specific serine/threonine protein kinase n=1 Tax=Gymnopus androsaceus JB14 TaxID=1447944 RepID=A0A6A4IBL5_9AGAR|nr:kinase-like protein [Gymnopus androsaceus JB14]